MKYFFNRKLTWLTKLVLLCSFISMTPLSLIGEAAYNVTVNIKNIKYENPIFVYLIDEGHFSKVGTGLEVKTINGEEASGSVLFTNVPEGTYAIRVYQDKNNNGVLDSGILGPKEPWALSWKTKPKYPVSFSDISFNLEKDKEFQLELSK